MVKKIVFIALVAAALLCGTWGYFYLQNLKKPTLKAFDVLPDSCSMLAEIKEPKNFIAQLTQGNLVWEEFLKIKDVKELNSVLSLIDSLTTDEETRDHLGNEPFYIALYGKQQQAVYAFNISDVNESENTLALFEKHFTAQKISSGFYSCVLNCNGKCNFYLYTEAGLVIASTDRTLVEQISEKGKQSLSANKKFVASYKIAGKNKGMSLFVHQPFFYSQNWNRYFAPITKENFFASTAEDWVPVDVGIEPSDINLQGFLPADSTRLNRIIQDQPAGDLKDLYEHLPYTTFSLEAVSLSDYGVFCKDNYMGDGAKRKSDLTKYSDSLSADGQTEIISFIGNYLGNFKTTTNDTIYEYGIVDAPEELKARNFFRSTADSVILNTDSANLFLFSDQRMFNLLSASFFSKGFRYASVINECAVFCNSVKGLAEYRRSVTEKTNFTGNERALNFIERNFNSDLNYIYYSDVFRNKNEIRNSLSASLNKKLDESPELFEKFDAIGFSLQKLKDKVFYKGHASFNPKNKMYQNTLWEALVDTDLYKVPVPMINHKTGEKELLCQDLSHNLYLISNTGKVLWKKNVGEKMLGDVTQIDFFGNGKLQMLFSSDNFIHLVDRNGNYVEGFPVKIKAGAAGGVSVFDYDNSRNYRLWMPLKNNTVICLNTNCKSVEGFVSVPIKAPLAGSIQHVLLQQKDYFILIDTAGNVYLTNRKGEQRASMTHKLPSGNIPVYLQVGKDESKTYLCFVDLSSKTLGKLSLADKMETSPLKTDVEPVSYFFDTLQNRQAVSVVLAGEKQMQAFDLFANGSLEVELKEESNGAAEALLFGAHKVYAAMAKTETLLLWNVKTRTPIDNEIKLSALPASYKLIKGRDNYLVGFYRNKIFCIKP